MATSEIEKLERRYAENPHGLTFAPLAEVHRKNGDVTRALELLTAGLELHPNYIPASIVLGRCHQDLGDLPSAEAAFGHVLRLDDENVIALKSLADISERQDRFADAEGWLRRLVAVDRSNDEAREQLRRIEAREKEVEAAREPEATSATLEVLDLGPEPVAEAAEPAVAGAEPGATSPDLAPAELTAPGTPELDAAAAGPVEGQVPAASAAEKEEPAPPETVPPMTGLISAEFEPPLEAIGGIGVETSEEVVLDASGNSEFSVPDASEDFRALAERLSAPRQRSPAPPPEAAPKLVEDASAMDAEPEPAAPRATEEGQMVGAPAPRRSYLAQETRGRSVAAFFQSLLAARPPAEAGPAGARTGSQVDRGSPTRNPHDAGSFGALANDDMLPVPPAVPAADQKADGAVSFDDFFGSDRKGSAPARQRGDPGKDDLDQFQTWLQNLKR